MTSDYAYAFAEAVAREINAERGRQGFSSIRSFARLLGDSDHTSITKRLNLEPTDGKPPIIINMVDLASYARALKVQPSELLRLAEERVNRETHHDIPADVAAGLGVYHRGGRRGGGNDDGPPDDKGDALDSA